MFEEQATSDEFCEMDKAEREAREITKQQERRLAKNSNQDKRKLCS